jgi:hypothetical protein
VIYQFLRPLRPPEVLVSVGDVRLDGRVVEACWPQRGGELDCTREDGTPEARAVPGEGELRLVVAYPAQPQDGEITIARGRKTVESHDDWDREVGYDLPPGEYTLDVQARYPEDASLHYVFPFRVTRSGA